MPFDLEDFPPLLAEDLPPPADDLEVVFALLPPLLPDEDEALFDFDAPEDFAPLLAVFPASFDFVEPALPVVAPPADFDLADEDFLPPPLPPPTRSPTASATTLSALTAAPFAAPVKISPATSVALPKTAPPLLAVDFFVVDFDEEELFAGALDFEEDELFAGALDFEEAGVFAADFAGAEVFFVSVFDFAEDELFVFSGDLPFAVDF